MEKTQALRIAVLLGGSSLGLFVMQTQAQDLEREIVLTSAQAQAELDTRVRDELALAIAKVAVNEAGWGAPADVAMIHQITEGHGATDVERLAWLRAHSGCVLTYRPIERTRRNCRWARHLADNDLEPEGWPEDVLWQNYVRRWRQIRMLSRALVEGRSTIRPCRETPTTWGSPQDHERAIRNGRLRMVECRSTINRGYIAVARDPS
jgi:hypothetical protein